MSASDVRSRYGCTTVLLLLQEVERKQLEWLRKNGLPER